MVICASPVGKRLAVEPADELRPATFGIHGEKMSEEEFLPQALSETEAARYVGMSRSYLRKARMEGNRDRHKPAPPFLRIGRKILYLRGDLDQWLRHHRVTTPPTGQDSNDVLRATDG